MPLFYPQSWDFLGSQKFAAASSISNVITFPPRDLLSVQVMITGYSGGGDVGSLIFNGDTTANYSFKHAEAATNSTAFTVSSGAVTQKLAQLFPIAVAQGRSADVVITNPVATEKLGAINSITGGGSSGVAPRLQVGGFTWASATQITSLQLLTAAGAAMSSGTGIIVFGRNL